MRYNEQEILLREMRASFPNRDRPRLLHIIKTGTSQPMAVVAVRPFVDGKRGGCLNPEEINSRSPRWRTRRLGWPRLALTREKGFGRISKRATSIGAHYTRGDHEKNHPPRSTGALSGREGGAPTPPPARIKKRTRSLIISVEGQESAKRRSSAWRAARKSAPRHTA